MNEPLDVRQDGTIAWLTLNRPTDGNSINAPLAMALLNAATDCAADEGVRCVVVTGGGRMFCGGGDIKTFNGEGGPVAAIDAITGPLHAAIEALLSMGKPLVTLVNGPAAGAGLGLAMIGDIVLAGRSAHFTSAYTALGVTPDGSTSWILPRVVGLRRASDMIMTNRRIGSEEAERIGLITRAVDDEYLLAEGNAVAGQLAAGAIGALANARRLLAEGLGRSLHDHLAIEAKSIAAAAAGPEGQEGIAAFMDKRRPDYPKLS